MDRTAISGAADLRPDPFALAAGLAAHPSIRGKLDIALATKGLGLSTGSQGAPGDDAAAMPDGAGGWDLFAGEGFMPAFVAHDPWFAGWCGVMVNLSDIAAMGGRATALLDAVWAPDATTAAPLLQGMRDASAAYGVPIVGGHTNLHSTALNLAVSVTGKAQALIRGSGARAGDVLIAAIDHRGSYRNFDNFCAALDAPPARLRGDLALLPELAEAGLVTGGKDISQGGIAGTALMLAEASGCGLRIALDDIPLPDGAGLDRWLRSFPSFGFLLTARPAHVDDICRRFAARDIPAAVIGEAIAGSRVEFASGGLVAPFWDHAARPYLSLKPEHSDA
ncbi:sll0787 family AIR synthase-like protein [Paracoccus aestuariivivens]|uniref:Sll0787 family AIR synthase-like protein n=1 Tax=Paracoccus aestuariivivens TaxID=1820333 RepID=A0A6L6JEW7_9RHOB|nr:sll0787 family AIR synthase-like protein [Paracoccus aestuariivivens]MTH78481.1 sll0787 family AIR synthase-like protein [Paracoccus aestuariivivens]